MSDMLGIVAYSDDSVHLAYGTASPICDASVGAEQWRGAKVVHLPDDAEALLDDEQEPLGTSLTCESCRSVAQNALTGGGEDDE